MNLLNKTLRIQEGKLIHKIPVGFRVDEDRIWFQRTGFSKVLNRFIKTMKSYKWHGHLDPPIKKWSIANCPRNVFQLMYHWGEPVYEWFERPLIGGLVFDRPEFEKYGAEIAPQQIDMVRRGLTYHYQILAAEPGLGKSLAAMEIMQRSGKKNWWFCGPKSALASVELEFKKWGLDPSIKLTVLGYEMLVKKIRYDIGKFDVPDGVIFDEMSCLKDPTTHRATAAQAIADMVRQEHQMEGYVIGLTGTPTAKNPLELWSQCEITWPGFLKEGSYRAFERRYAIVEEREDMDGVKYSPRVGWNEEEIARLPKRYAGLMTVYRKVDWLDLPQKKFIKINVEPSKKVLRVAKSLCNIAPNVITALTWTRALSSGFQYQTKQIGEEKCSVCGGGGKYEYTEDKVCPCCAGTGLVPAYERVTRRVKCPKDAVLRNLLDQNENHGRIVIAGSFQGSIDRILAICKQRGWAVACIDGRGWRSYDNQGGSIKTKPLDLWEECEGKVAFVCNPGSARYGLTLTRAYMLVFFDNNFSAEHRLQMMDRIHRMSMNKELGATIVDVVHLPIDQRVLDVLDSNRKLELLSLDALSELCGEEESDDWLEEEQ